MRIALDIRYRVESGPSTYIRNIAPLLVTTGSSHDFAVVSNGQLHLPFPNVVENYELPYLNKAKELIWTQTILPRLLREWKIDIYHSLKHIPPLFPGVKTIFTLGSVGSYTGDYPLSFFEHIYWNHIRKIVMKKSNKVIVKSNHNEDVLINIVGLPSTKVTIINNGVEENFGVIEKQEIIDLLKQEYNLNRPFVLCVGNLVPVKNHMVVIKACEKLWREESLPYDLVMIGGEYHGYANELKEYANSSIFHDKFHFIGFLNRNVLPLFYNSALCLVHPSLHEGFPMVPLEAMACGLPVICTLRGGLKDACGDAALYLSDPDDAETLATLLKDVSSDQQLQGELHNKGIQRAKQFTWEAAAQKTIKVYEDLNSLVL